MRGESLEQRGRREYSSTRRRELHRKRQVVEPRAQRGDGYTSLHSVETCACGPRSRMEELDGILGRERLDREDTARRDGQRLSARGDDDDIRARSGDGRRRVRDRFDQVLAVVEQQKGPLPRE